MGMLIDPRIRRRRFLAGLPPLAEVAVRPPARTITRAELERERLIDEICLARDGDVTRITRRNPESRIARRVSV